MFVDASALVAILLRESGHEALVNLLERSPEPLKVSPCVRFEATLGVARGRSTSGRGRDVRIAARAVDEFLREIGAVEIDITPAIGRAAIEAAQRFGKVAGHPARLNFGDCFAYACAAHHGDALLFIGDDFSRTDICPALK